MERIFSSMTFLRWWQGTYFLLEDGFYVKMQLQLLFFDYKDELCGRVNKQWAKAQKAQIV